MGCGDHCRLWCLAFSYPEPINPGSLRLCQRRGNAACGHFEATCSLPSKPEGVWTGPGSGPILRRVGVKPVARVASPRPGPSLVSMLRVSEGGVGVHPVCGLRRVWSLSPEPLFSATSLELTKVFAEHGSTKRLFSHGVCSLGGSAGC